MFTEAHWLILLIPIIWYVLRTPLPSRKIRSIRALMVICVLLALAGLQLRLPGREGVIVVVADRSLSMPSLSDARIGETMELLKSQMPANAKLGLVSFADEARVEMPPTRSAFTTFSGDINQEASNLNDAINRALSLVPEDLSARIVVISDGLWSGKDPEESAFKAAGRSIPIDYRLLSRSGEDDTAITDFSVPSMLNPGESFVISAEILSPFEQQAHINLQCSGRNVADFSKKLRRGRNSVIFRHTAPSASVARYRLSVKGESDDSVPENNQAFAVSEILGKKPVLIISDFQGSPLHGLLKSVGQGVESRSPGGINWSIEFLAGYSAVIIENISADRLSLHGMQMLAAWVRHIGGGLFITGGKNSYGNGGYYQSPLEEILPVSLELRSEHRKMALAMMVVLDRSGSMAAPTRGDRTKMDLANIAAASSMDLLSQHDEFGLLAVDTEAHVIVPLQPLVDKERWRDKILRVESMGGGIYVYEGISKAAEMLLSAKAGARHIILFADASDAEEPGRYWELLDKLCKTGMTLSVIGLGTENDSDANLLVKIAEAGKGRIFFTREPEELPRLFAQDTFVAARSTFVEEITEVESLPASSMFADDKQLAFKSTIGAYNLCYLRPEATLVAKTLDENHAPLLTAWQCGLGRVVCYTGTTEGAAGGEFLRQPQSSDIFASVCGWLTLDNRQDLGEMMVTQQIIDGRWKAIIHLDPERERELFSDTPEIDVLRSFSGRSPERETIAMSWETADSLAAELPLKGNEVIVAMVKSGPKNLRLPPVCLPYASEYALQSSNAGAEKLRSIASISGGRELIDLSRAWETMPSNIQFRGLSGELLFLALFLFILEIAERRTAVLSLFADKLRRRRGKKKSASFRRAADIEAPVTSIVTLDQSPKIVAEIPDKAESSPVNNDSGVAAALKKAKKDAGKRTSG
ncbi:MAG: VWA domain-containing protein [Candidatus Riflebacteria bacterium]|nr:VWA domain-containing protein [Candidatus Riflebacteria bacterium]